MERRAKPDFTLALKPTDALLVRVQNEDDPGGNRIGEPREVDPRRRVGKRISTSRGRDGREKREKKRFCLSRLPQQQGLSGR